MFSNSESSVVLCPVPVSVWLCVLPEELGTGLREHPQGLAALLASARSVCASSCLGQAAAALHEQLSEMLLLVVC